MTEKNPTFDERSFYAARDSSYYVLLDSDTLENIVDLIRREGGGI